MSFPSTFKYATSDFNTGISKSASIKKACHTYSFCHSFRKDSVQISDGYRTQIGEKLCGSLKDLQSNPVQVKGASAYVKFTSDSVGEAKGFKATYQALGERASKYLKFVINSAL